MKTAATYYNDMPKETSKLVSYADEIILALGREMCSAVPQI